MAGETRPSGRSRPIRETPDSSEPTLPGSDPSMAPITANTPLPPLTPLPLASQPGAGGAASQPPPGASPQPTDQPTLPPLPPSTYQSQPPYAEAAQQPPPGGEAGSGINSTWASYTTFALVYTSLILLTAIAIASDAITKSGGLLVIVFIIIVIVNIVYPLIVFGNARPGSMRSMRLPFTPPRRGP